MASDHVKRKLAAILAADIAGYSRLMGADEAGTLARLKEYRRELIDPKNKQYRGCVVKRQVMASSSSFRAMTPARKVKTLNRQRGRQL